jgi:hypothetical protein
MQTQVYAFPVLMLALFAGYAVWMMSKTKRAVASLGPAMHGFFARSGYRYPDMAPEPVESHVQRALTDAQGLMAGNVQTQTHYVRNFHGLAVHFTQGSQATERGHSYWSQWTAPIAAPPRVPFHIADKSLASLGKAVREAFSNTTRHWQARYPHPVETGIPAIDSRFVVYGTDPNAVRYVLQQNPALVAALMQATEVDLWVDAQNATFNDPAQKNINAALGGMVGQMALGFDYGKRMDMSLPVHDRVAELLAMAVRAAQ